MNQNRLQQKRRKRQAKRKLAQATARRRVIAESRNPTSDWRGRLGRAQPAESEQSLLSRLIGMGGGARIAPDQMDQDPAPIVGGGL